MLLTLVSFAFVITVLVFIHELGHYLAARSTGMRVEKFSVGFPPRFISFTSRPNRWNVKVFFYKKDEHGKINWLPIFEINIPVSEKKGSGTEYCLALLPLGGYVKVSGILDESMDPNSTGADYEYQSKKTWQKLWFTSAGVIFNFILSFFIFILLFMFNGYAKNEIESVFNKLPNISIKDVKFNNSKLKGDENFFMGVNYNPEIDENNGIVRVNESIGDLSIFNLNAEKINEIEFTLPFKVDRIVNGLVDSNQVSISITDNSSFKVNFENSSEVLDNRVIYLGKVFHEKLDYNQSPSYGILNKGDKLISINNNKVKYYKDIAPLIAQNSENPSEVKPLIIEIQNSEEKKMVEIHPSTFEKYNEYGELINFGRIGVTFKTDNVNLFEAISISVYTLFESIWKTFKGIFELITGQISGKSVSGPIGIAKISGEFANQGFIPLLSLMAFLSISLGVINILPFPGLDGGHALIAIIEKLKGEKISPKTLVKVQQFGMLVLMSLFFLIILKDLGFL